MAAERKGTPAEGSKSSNGRQKLGKREVFMLVLRTYWTTLPYIVIFVAVMLVATWFVTEVLFR